MRRRELVRGIAAAGGITAARNHTEFDVAPDGGYALEIGKR